MSLSLLQSMAQASGAAGINFERLAELEREADANPPRTFLGEARLYPNVLPHKWKRLTADFGGMDFPGIYRSRCGLLVLMSVGEHDGKFWLHVSFSRKNSLPAYADMAEVKELFIGADKTALQVFPARDKHVNIHPHTLHLWHCLDGDVTPDFTKGTGSI